MNKVKKIRYITRRLIFGTGKKNIIKSIIQNPSYRYIREFWFSINHENENDLFEINLKNVGSKNPILVVDIGAFEGLFASRFLKENCDARMILIEPVTKFCEILEDKFGSNPNVSIIKKALTSDSRKISIDVNGASSSALSESKSVQEFYSISVNELSKLVGDRSVSLLQINCEGMEYELLPSIIESGFINKIEMLQIQFHYLNLRNLLLRRKISKKLAKTHVRRWSTLFIWEKWELVQR